MTGAVHYIGRRDDQVQINGNRLELSAVDAQLEAASGAREAMVKLREDGSNQLIGYVAGKEDALLEDNWQYLSEAEFENVRRKLSKALPPYAIPTTIVYVAEIPKTSHSGKKSRRSLPLVPRKLAERGEFQVAENSDPVEAALLKIAKTVCHEEISPLDEFYSVFDSLHLARFFGEVRNLGAGHMDLPVSAKHIRMSDLSFPLSNVRKLATAMQTVPSLRKKEHNQQRYGTALAAVSSDTSNKSDCQVGGWALA